ncbi:FG-GAP repeat domain-containing protein [Sinomonas sp. B1-1]|uniref:FG-GAP repeat domain-containing protein n=1 Tax=Sinomonas sp. B1-1 TaxID=3141454 RepID=UPI003D2BC93D
MHHRALFRRAGRRWPRRLAAAAAAIVLIATGVGTVPASAQVNAASPPRLLDVRVTSPAVLTPGQSLTIDFTLSQAADYVEFSVDGLESPEYLRATSGPVSGSGPFTGRAVLPVDADQGHLKWSGAYSITRVRVGYAKAFLGYLNGQQYWYNATADYARDGSCQQSEAGYCLPGYAYGTTTFTVDAPAYRISDNANLTPPAIVGTPGYGETISLVDATWAAGKSGRKTYLRDGVEVDHPDWVVEEDIGHDLSVHLESFAEGYRPAGATSAPVRITSPITASPARLTGRAVVGQRVTAAFDESSVAVTPPQPFTVSYKLNYQPATPDQFAHTLAARDAGRKYRLEAMVTTTGTPSAQRPFSATTPGIVRYKVAGEGFDAGFAPDIFARDAGGRLLLYPTDGVGRWLPARTVGVGWDVFDLVLNVGDFDGDGNGDVLARDTSGNLFLYPGDGHGDWLPRRQIGWGWNECGAIVPVGDFDADGINDLLCRATDGGLVFFPGQGDGTFRPTRGYSVNRLHTAATPGWYNPLIGDGWNSLSQVFSPGDFDGDGRNDVLARDAGGQLLLFRGDGKGGWLSDRATVVGWGWGGMARIGGAGDFDGDGTQDVWAVDGGGRLLVYFGNGRGGWRGSAVVGTGWSGFTSVF